MSKIFVTGSLVDVSDSTGVIKAKFLHTGRTGILLTGVFGATGLVSLIAGEEILANVTSVTNPASSNNTLIRWDSPGLHFVPHIYDNIALVLSLGTIGVTVINFTIFIGQRP